MKQDAKILRPTKVKTSEDTPVTQFELLSSTR